jgi:hypothetical protein
MLVVQPAILFPLLLTWCPPHELQATGAASGTSGYVNITRKDGKVSFTTDDGDDTAKPTRYV